MKNKTTLYRAETS